MTLRFFNLFASGRN